MWKGGGGKSHSACMYKMRVIVHTCKKWESSSIHVKNESHRPSSIPFSERDNEKKGQKRVNLGKFR